jgi:hypothetical protein
MLYLIGNTVGVDNVSFVFYGDGAPLLTNGLVLKLITFTTQPPILYVGPGNARSVSLITPTPFPGFMSVLVTIDGEQNALKISPTTLSWDSNSPREQKISLTGAYGSPVSCLLRYRLIEGPSNVDVQSSLGGQATVVTDLRPVAKTPARSRFTLPELSVFTLTFSPNMPVDCTFSPNIASSIADNSTNKTIVTLLVVGVSTANCVPRDPTYAPLDPFTIEATPLKRFTIVPKVANTFVGTEVDVDFYVSSAPAGGTMTVRPNMTLLGPYVTAKPGIILFTSVSALQSRITFTGLALTPGPMTVPLIFSGPVAEFLLNSAATSLTVSVLAPINLTYTPSALMAQTRIGDTFTSYVGTDNSMLWTFEIAGSDGG